MAKITKMDKAVAQKITPEFVAAMQKVADKYGMKVTSRGGNFNNMAITMKIEVSCTEITSTGDTIDAEAKAFQDDAALVGLNPNMLFATFDRNGDTMKIVGLKLRRSKFPVVIQNVATGKKVLCTVDYLKTFKLKLVTGAKPAAKTAKSAAKKPVTKTAAKAKKLTWLCKEGREKFTVEAVSREAAEEAAAAYNGVVIRQLRK